MQKRILEREAAWAPIISEKLDADWRSKRKLPTRSSLTLKERWKKERDLVAESANCAASSKRAHGKPAAAAAARNADGGIAAVPRRRRVQPRSAQRPAALKSELQALEAELSALQGETGLMRVCVDAQIVGEVISAWTGIPVGKMLKDEITTVLALAGAPGQARHRPGPRDGDHQPAHAHLARIARRSRTSRSAFSCWWDRAAWARPKPRSPCPTCSMAASTI